MTKPVQITKAQESEIAIRHNLALRAAVWLTDHGKARIYINVGAGRERVYKVMGGQHVASFTPEQHSRILTLAARAGRVKAIQEANSLRAMRKDYRIHIDRIKKICEKYAGKPVPKVEEKPDPVRTFMTMRLCSNPTSAGYYWSQP